MTQIEKLICGGLNEGEMREGYNILIHREGSGREEKNDSNVTENHTRRMSYEIFIIDNKRYTRVYV